MNFDRYADVSGPGEQRERWNDNSSNLTPSSFSAWTSSKEAPLSVLEIAKIFDKLRLVFGFQQDNVNNILEFFMTLIDSRAARMGCLLALRTIHGDYIGGPNANFRKWYFAAGMDADDLQKSAGREKNFDAYLKESESLWYRSFLLLSANEYVEQVALYLLCWGEANNVRFMPECLCFIYKCCIDHYLEVRDTTVNGESTTSFLDYVITPLYLTLKNASYDEINGKRLHKDKDHAGIVGYDDINQTFWYREGLNKLVLENKTRLMSLPREARYAALGSVNWKGAFIKTYRETRSWGHLLVNFSRVFIIHVYVFWIYTAYNAYPIYTLGYLMRRDNRPSKALVLFVLSLGGVVVTSINLVATVLELWFVPRRWAGAQSRWKRIAIDLFLIALFVCPHVAIRYLSLLNTKIDLGVSIALFVLSLVTALFFAYTPTAYPKFGGNTRRLLALKTFTSDVYPLKGTEKVASIALWCGVWASKCFESYFFLALSFKDPMRELSITRVRCAGDWWIGSSLCEQQPLIVLFLMTILYFVLFLLDTYLWYVIWNTGLSVVRSFYIGASIWTPWRNIFSRLPKRIHSKLLVTSNSHKMASKLQVSKVWNSIIILMYREHFISIEQVQKLLYQCTSDEHNELVLREPTFFVSQEDESLKSNLFYENSEAQRRITFFAQSLSTPMPDIREVRSMPTFSVFIPHYSEKILLLLREIIREEDKYSQITMLEYLKQLHELEWSNFVRDSRQMAEESDLKLLDSSESHSTQNDLQFESVGYKVATPEYVLRTRIWASLRTQTLFRTVSGFMNYSRAIKLLFDLETSKQMVDDDSLDEKRLNAINDMSLRKFKLVISMQRFTHFSDDERENTAFLLRAYSDLQIAYIDEEVNSETGEIAYYSCLIDGNCALLEDGSRKPKFRIRLSGYPVLGDGKSDNQNHAIIFTRGEYLQLIDANQDNYLEECLKIRSVLAEFEELILSDPYNADSRRAINTNPVAIIGTREYIFSENIGVLGDVAAAKEQTFGTLFARTLAQIGGKLHYGHPDFLNLIFMTTRGGVSKAQKGLHLNEDIYAGMTAVTRGGRVKHCEYIQCGKGRDLGFILILNFTTKIGAGMGEQLLSREYFYLGTLLSLDRFLSFYYAHIGFHLNNVYITISIQVFLILGINLAALTKDSVVCEYDKFRPITDPRTPEGCSNLIPVVKWMERCIFSIVLVFFMSFLPLGVQEVTERGVYKAISRLGKHFLSLSPLFEVFVSKIYAQALVDDISLGGAQYIATGRGFATTRNRFSDLYARYCDTSLKFGAFSLLLVTYLTTALWKPAFIYFWLTATGLLLCPFLYNPNQYSWVDYFLDYKNLLRWLHSGNREYDSNSWASYAKLARSRYTGLKRKLYYSEDEVKLTNDVRPSRVNLVMTKVLPHTAISFFVLCAYLFSNSNNGSPGAAKSSALARVLITASLPLAWNLGILLVGFVISVAFGPFLSALISTLPAVISFVVHSLSIAGHVLSLHLLLYLENYRFGQFVLATSVTIAVQHLLLQIIGIVFLTRELRSSQSNRAWWSGKWFSAKLGWRVLTEPFRELVCKFVELPGFTADFFICHLLFYAQLPLLLIPLANTWHSMMLLWLKPGSQLRQRVLTRQERKARNQALFKALVLFITGFVLIAGFVVAPAVLMRLGIVDVNKMVPRKVGLLRQQNSASALTTGIHKSLEIKH